MSKSRYSIRVSAALNNGLNYGTVTFSSYSYFLLLLYSRYNRAHSYIIIRYRLLHVSYSDNKQNNQNRPKVFSQHDNNSNYWNISHWLDSDNTDTNMTDHATWILIGTYYQEHKSITVVM